MFQRDKKNKENDANVDADRSGNWKGVLAKSTGLSQMGSALLGDIAGATAPLFCTNDDLQIEDKSTYLFYARENGFISTTRPRSGF